MDWKLPPRTPLQDVHPSSPPGVARVLTQLEHPAQSLSNSETGNYSPERRSSARFPLELPAELLAGNVRLKTTTANISSGGLLLSCDQEVEIGTLATVRVSWPISQRSKQVVLVVQGEIIRREPCHLAIRHRRHEFEVAPQTRLSSSPFSWQHHFTSLAPILATLCFSF